MIYPVLEEILCNQIWDAPESLGAKTRKSSFVILLNSSIGEKALNSKKSPNFKFF